MTSKKDKQASGSAIAGAGATTAGVGLVGGGIPGFKSDASKLTNLKQGSFRHRAGSALSSGRGGVFGYRADAHQGFLNQQRADEKKHAGKPTSRANMYLRGQGSGKIKPEVDIIRHMKRGRAASGVALVGGTAATAYGAKRAKDQKVSKADRDKTWATMAGAGGAAAATTAGGSRILEHQGRKWSARSAQSIDEAKKIVPNMGGYTTGRERDARFKMNPRVPDVNPDLGGKKIATDKKILAGKSKVQAEAAGRHRGAAQQQRYFAGVYGKTAKLARRGTAPALTTAAVGAGGLALSRRKRSSSKVSKGRIMSDAEIRRRKKVQGTVSRTTSTLGLAGVGVGTAAALASKKPGALKAIRRAPGMKNTTASGLKDAGLYTSLASGGIGGVGGYNFAAYTGAESRKRKPVVKSMEIEMGYYGEEGHPVELPEIKVPIEKAWSPVAGNYDSERSRQKRGKAYEGGALVAAGGGGAYAAHHGMQAVKDRKSLRPREMAPVSDAKVNRAGDVRKVPHWKEPGHLLTEKAIPTKGLKPAGKTAAGLAVVGAAAGAHGAIKRKRKKSWQPYAKRDTTSAFGIDHQLGTEWTAP